MNMTIEFPKESTWVKLLMRWSDFPNCGEKKLICAVIALAIVDDKNKNELDALINRTMFFKEGLEKYCRMINLNSDFVCEQVLKVSSRVGDVVRVPV